jgi:hypothetical protein
MVNSVELYWERPEEPSVLSPVFRGANESFAVTQERKKTDMDG